MWIDRGYLAHLERGTRVPGAAVAAGLADVLGLDQAERDRLFAVAVTDAGRGSR